MVTWDKPGLFGQVMLTISMVILAVLMVFPFLYVIAVSFSSYADVAGGGLIIFPAHPTLEAYLWVFRGSGLMRALGVSSFIAVVGTAISMFLTITLAYVLSQRDIPGGRVVLWMLLLTLLITPSIITKYLVVRQLGLTDTIWALVIPSAVTPFNVVVMRQFFLSVPNELIDSARLDGANDLQILWRIVLPLSRAALAAIALFYAVTGWNSFFEPVIYLNDPQLYPFSVILQQLVLQGGLAAEEQMPGQMPPPPDITIQMAVVVIAIVPILLIYPFLQKYFTKGVLTGSIKG